jgi:hypothetical protein
MASIAKAYTGFSRAVSEPVVRAAFNQPEREVETVECLYERIQARLLAEPERYSWRYILVAAQLTRRRSESNPRAASSGSCMMHRVECLAAQGFLKNLTG